ncbi:4-hydroxy-tetrahydrodipicolinate synthase [Companilactobacillus kimchii]|uniref:4-hydroxy-tetrahydrodipicolinate synthase n=2 Tax=Companilactobacillus kimchii TaxID=2801452 RepID=A0ABR5NQY5_9LACO|nr:4-hydroxy-tetrahydrodipicolinate synthase [Companilactobacillus kimchii]KAE9562998.1 4-hydroxy-tetrahydrodipicolinate synthase [Companilactobacillus kimchii]KRK50040.1 dihydrodipicolinate synthase [Companilactobacillus kimchii DSM 13961 = JCM 10707]OWF32081.1 4-hydroxy-tetrahydrodipicolinate synthase [Companilactobacillus kimchii]GEO48088.1 4-hydroxy-tetrahydrodipicolinate synthase [Companilactobacillus paralimentarius]
MFTDVDLMTAIITPFDEELKIDYKALKKLTEHLLATGSKGFVIGGTTGETPTLTENEKLDLYRHFTEIVDERVPIIAGAGSNNTVQTIDFINKLAQVQGIDMALVVVPYYNKPNQRGMIAHFEAIAKNSPLPIMIYNIPGRTGVLMEKETVVKLSQNNNISGVKQCNTMEDLEYIVEHTADDFNVYSGEDAQALFAKVIGANGVISVASHLYGDEMTKMYQKLNAGDYKTAGKIQRQLTPKMAALFMYPSPSPVKAALNKLGYEVGGCRLPIVSLNEAEKNVLFEKLNL